MFMVRSHDTTNTVSAVEDRVKRIEQTTDTTYRRVAVIDDNLTRIDKKVEGLKHEMCIREGKDTDFQKTQETLATRVETAGKSLATFRKEQTDKEETDSKRIATFKKELSGKEEGTNKHLDAFYKELSIMKSKTSDVLQVKAVVNDAHAHVRRVNDHATAQGDKNQELHCRLQDYTDRITALELGMANRTDDLQVCQQDTSSLREVTNDFQAWSWKSEVELDRLSKSEVKWSITSEESKKYSKKK